MKRILYIGCLLGVATIFHNCNNTKKQPKNLTQEVIFTKEGTGTITNIAKDSTFLNIDLEFAQNDYETQTGLMYRSGMKNSEGMLFIFPDERMRSFYMKNTQFPLDIIYLNSDQEIVHIHKNAVPYDENSISSQKPAQYVLEINAGLSNEKQLKVGQILSWTTN